MKKAGLILLLCIYALSIFGISLKKFYCCGRLISISVSIAQTVEQGKRTGDGCCKTQYQSFKVKDNHIGSSQVSLPEISCTGILHSIPLSQVDLCSLEVNRINKSHDPPGSEGNPPYILNRVFRI